MLQPDISQIVFDQCALCANSSDLQASHIIPGFVFDWLRESSATGHFRFFQSPNLRVQDGLKPRMLCWNCEQLFSCWEKKFAEECFVPINGSLVRQIIYRSWMLKFATSVSWRVLRVFAASGGLSGFPEHIMIDVNDALYEWSEFLFGNKPSPGRFEQHMFVVDVVDSTSMTNVPHNISRYLSRAVEPYVTHNHDSAFTYAKMGRIMLFGFISMKHPRRWEGTKLHVRHGQFSQDNIELPSDVGDFIFGRANLAAEMYSQISDKQRAKIRKSYEENLDRAAQSETLRAMHHDVSMFGKNAFEATQPSTRHDAAKDEE